MSISLSTITQGDAYTPFWCINCYGERKKVPAPIKNPQWFALSLRERVFQIGLLPPDEMARATIVKKSAARVYGVHSYAG
jgi:hypothetical protein